MTETTSAVTPERYERAATYADYLASIDLNRDQFQHYYDAATLSPDDVAFFQRAVAAASGPAKMLVIAEAWCPDVYRGVPVLVRIAEACGMDLRIVLRDENPDIMDEFLLNGKARAIPVAVFYTDDLRYLAHWTERPEVAHEEIRRLRAELEAIHPKRRHADDEGVLRRPSAATVSRVADRKHTRDSRTPREDTAS